MKKKMEIESILAAQKKPEVIPNMMSMDIPDEDMGVMELTEQQMEDIMAGSMTFVDDTSEAQTDEHYDIPENSPFLS
jgi:hypothetical protein